MVSAVAFPALLSSSEPLKRVAASNSSSIILAATRGWCHTTLDIMFSSSEISNGSITVVKVPMVTLFFLMGSVADEPAKPDEAADAG